VGILEISKLPSLVQKLDIKVSASRLNELVSNKIYVSPAIDTGDFDDDGLDFERFASIIVEILVGHHVV
jgi:hypothetical protein